MASIVNDINNDELSELFGRMGIQSKISTELPKVAVMNFGRLNPPTRGHFKLLNFISEQATSLGGNGFIFVSASKNFLPPHKGTKWRPPVSQVTKSTYRSNKSNENPLSVWDKMNVLHKFPKINNLEYINPQGEKGRPYTMERAANYLRKKGYNDIYLVVGTDRFEQLKQQRVENKWDITLIEHPRSERLEDLTLYSIDTEAKLHKKHFKTPPQAISGTQARAAAAEHAINNINKIDTMTERQAETAIENRKKPIYRGHGFMAFKEYMPYNLTDVQLELIIYIIKKGMLLRPSQSYTNNHMKNRMVRRSSLKKKGGKRRRTRRRKGGVELNWKYLPKSLDNKDEEYDRLPNNEMYKITKIGQNRIYFNGGEETLDENFSIIKNLLNTYFVRSRDVRDSHGGKKQRKSRKKRKSRRKRRSRRRRR
ncbi:MAG: hypothetical protein CXT73_06415 [Methanobacteriota archaeon]|nr:MAG: hypothetical protein CXT73_06415 [Euryarchaeota archaeon]